MSIFDLHVHTTKGSSDSSLTPAQINERFATLNVDGVCLTEHSGGWDKNNLQKYFPTNEPVVIGGLEITTDMGHVLVFGMNSYVSGMNQINELRKIVDRAGAIMVAAHPFRNIFNTTNNVNNLIFEEIVASNPSDIAIVEHPLFSLVDEIEVINGGNTDRENQFAIDVADRLDLKGLGGSDAHSLHGLGKYVTTLNGDIRNESQLIECLRSKSFQAGKLVNNVPVDSKTGIGQKETSREYHDSI